MPVEPLATWNDTLNSLPKVADTSWTDNLTGWYKDNIANITPDPSLLAASGFTFTFNEAIFKTQLLTLAPTPDALAGITGFANAWQAAINATIIVCGPGTTLQPSSPATIFSVVAATIIDPSSVVLGFNKILEIADASPEDPPIFAEKFREATLQLKIIISGTNSITPTPTPLITPPINLI